MALKEVAVTTSRLLEVWWALMWRTFMFSIVSVVLGGLIGFSVGKLMEVVRQEAVIPIDSALFVGSLVTLLICVPIGIYLSMVPLRMVLSTPFSGFSLKFVRETKNEATAEYDAS
jgi:hypothetical protein